ncbi:AI-2E family transporter [Tepidicaulis sp. LMO-SS28]|uniref:AI-2E family transporter n=1 Tax=Tepidicaulis sp. LMO-SS28 TaxID=3447455 RepID=UPI003EE0BAE0
MQDGDNQNARNGNENGASSSVSFGGLMLPGTALSFLAILALLYTFYLAQALIAPVFTAIVVSFLFTPLLRLFPLKHLPDPAAAAIIVFTLLGLSSGGLYLLADPVSEWAERIPAAIEEFRQRTREITISMEEMREMADSLSDMEEEARNQDVVIQEASLANRALTLAGTIGTSLLIFFVFLYFILATNHLMRDRIVQIAPRIGDKEKARRIIRDIEREISGYLVSVTLINMGLGTAIGLCMWAIGLPNPVLWGAAGMILNYIPYLGPAIGMTLTGIAGFLTMPDPVYALLPPAFYFLCNLIESQLVLPTVIGRRHTINSAVVFLSIVFWGWMWGVIGAVLAVPILVIVKTAFSHLDRLQKFSVFIASEDRKPRRLPD